MKAGAAFAHDLDLQRLHDDIVKTSQVAEVPYNSDIIWSVLNTYKDFFTSSPVTLRTTTKPKEKRELNVRYIEVDALHDPFLIAVDAGLLKKEGHPVENLITEAWERFPMDGIGGYGIDLGANYGVEKIWPVFNGPQPVEEAYKMPSLPESAKSYADYFAKYNLSHLGLLGFDYRHKSVNFYFFCKAPLTEDDVIGMSKDLGFTPAPEIVEHCAKAPAVYFTFTWDSPNVERICFCKIGIDGDVPTHLHPIMKPFVANAPFISPVRLFFYNVALTRSGEYYLKPETDYNGKMGRLLQTLAMMAPQA